MTEAGRAEQVSRSGGFDALDRVVLALLIVNGVLTVVVEVLYLPTYLGAQAFPISAAFAAVINVALVLGAATVTDCGWLPAAPLIAWTVGLALCAMRGPGGDVLLAANLQWEAVLLGALGLGPACVLLIYRRAAALRDELAGARAAEAAS